MIGHFLKEVLTHACSLCLLGVLIGFLAEELLTCADLFGLKQISGRNDFYDESYWQENALLSVLYNASEYLYGRPISLGGRNAREYIVSSCVARRSTCFSACEYCVCDWDISEIARTSQLKTLAHGIFMCWWKVVERCKLEIECWTCCWRDAWVLYKFLLKGCNDAFKGRGKKTHHSLFPLPYLQQSFHEFFYLLYLLPAKFWRDIQEDHWKF